MCETRQPIKQSDISTAWVEHTLWSGSALGSFSAFLLLVVGLSTLPIIETRAWGGPCRMTCTVSAARCLLELKVSVSNRELALFGREVPVRFIIFDAEISDFRDLRDFLLRGFYTSAIRTTHQLNEGHQYKC